MTRRPTPNAVNSSYNLGLAMEVQAGIWYRQHRLEEAKSEALRAADIFWELRIAEGAEAWRTFVQHVQRELDNRVASGKSGSDCELLQTVPFRAHIDFSF